MPHHEDGDLSDAAVEANRREKRVASGVIGYIFEEGNTMHTGEIRTGFFVRLRMPSGTFFDIRVEGEREEVVITTPAKSGHIGVIFGRENAVHVGLIP